MPQALTLFSLGDTIFGGSLFINNFDICTYFAHDKLKTTHFVNKMFYSVVITPAGLDS
jgi:hypothetical protein